MRKHLNVRDFLFQLGRRVGSEGLEGVHDGSVARATADVAVKALLHVGHFQVVALVCQKADGERPKRTSIYFTVQLFLFAL